MAINQFAKIFPIVNEDGYILPVDKNGNLLTDYDVSSLKKIKNNEIGIVDYKYLVTSKNGVIVKLTDQSTSSGDTYHAKMIELNDTILTNKFGTSPTLTDWKSESSPQTLTMQQNADESGRGNALFSTGYQASTTSWEHRIRHNSSVTIKRGRTYQMRIKLKSSSLADISSTIQGQILNVRPSAYDGYTLVTPQKPFKDSPIYLSGKIQYHATDPVWRIITTQSVTVNDILNTAGESVDSMEVIPQMYIKTNQANSLSFYIEELTFIEVPAGISGFDILTDSSLPCTINRIDLISKTDIIYNSNKLQDGLIRITSKSSDGSDVTICNIPINGDIELTGMNDSYSSLIFIRCYSDLSFYIIKINSDGSELDVTNCVSNVNILGSIEYIYGE